MITSVQEAAAEYIARGWAPIPVIWREKKPVHKEWPKLRVTLETLTKFFNGDRLNIGVALGEASGNLTDTDLDWREALVTSGYYLPDTGSRFGRFGMPDSHRLFISNCPTKKFVDPVASDKKEAMIVELRSSGHHTVFPPSVHESGELIEWLCDNGPLEIDGADLTRRGGLIASSALVARYWPHHARHETSLALAGALRNSGWELEQVEIFVKAVVDAAGDEEITDRVRAARDTFASEKPTTGWPRLAKLLGRDLVDAVREWLGVSGAKDGEFSEPQPVPGKVAPEPYPLDALPRIVREAVVEVQDFVKAPFPLVSSSALTTMSLSTQAYIDVRRADKLDGPTGLFLVPIADSGERKTTCDNLFIKVIREHDAQEADMAREALKKYDAEFRGWNAEREGIELSIRNASKTGKEGTVSVLKQRLIELEEQKPEQPIVPKFLRMDDTPEKLAFVLAKEWPAAGVVSSEGSIILGAHAMGQYSIMRNLGLLNTLWDGGGVGVGRKTSESFEVQVARLTIGVQVQEATLRNFLDQSGGLPRSTGFLARVLISWPESTQGFRPFSEAPADWPKLSAFNRRIAEILKTPIPFDDRGVLAPRMLSLTPEAKSAWIKFHDGIEVLLRNGGSLYDVRDAASKCADNAVRLAALFQYFEDSADAGVVELEAFKGASRIAAWHLSESRRFFGELALPAETADVARLDAWLIGECRRTSSCCVSKRHAQRSGPLRDGAALNYAVDELVDLDRARLVKEGKRLDLYLNPALL